MYPVKKSDPNTVTIDLTQLRLQVDGHNCYLVIDTSKAIAEHNAEEQKLLPVGERKLPTE